MPLYEYMCETHGPFTEMRPMALSAEPCACPVCGGASPRVLLTAPAIGASDRGRMKAHAVNERAADAPKRASAHMSGPPAGGRSSLKPPRNRVMPNGTKSAVGSRPWALSY